MAPKRTSKQSRTSWTPPNPVKNPAEWEGDQYLFERAESTDPNKPGYVFTEAAEMAQRQKWERLIANRPPKKNISSKLLAGRSRKPPLLYYGWPFQDEYMLRYARRHSLSYRPSKDMRRVLNCGEEFNFADLTDKQLADKSLVFGLTHIARLVVLTELIGATGTPLELGRPFSLEWESILVLWTNYNVEERYTPMEVYNTCDKIVKKLTKAMNEEKDQGERTKLRWWWSWDNNVGVFTSVD
ncbi:hypothetical protein C8Q80DRAFT_1148991 [Daedaleopsis nitida]|nr:hypothetical protein C8Q80DRAFT_1148991 [Daedaleopsis nitida]